MRNTNHPDDEEDTFKCDYCKSCVNIFNKETISEDWLDNPEYHKHYCDVECLQSASYENYYEEA